MRWVAGKGEIWIARPIRWNEARTNRQEGLLARERHGGRHTRHRREQLEGSRGRWREEDLSAARAIEHVGWRRPEARGRLDLIVMAALAERELEQKEACVEPPRFGFRRDPTRKGNERVE